MNPLPSSAAATLAALAAPAGHGYSMGVILVELDAGSLDEFGRLRPSEIFSDAPPGSRSRSRTAPRRT